MEAIPPATPSWFAPEWEDVAPVFPASCSRPIPKGGCVSMLVRLAAGAEYPPHTHAAPRSCTCSRANWMTSASSTPVILRADPSTSDQRVWSETGCACVLVTSTKDALR